MDLAGIPRDSFSAEVLLLLMPDDPASDFIQRVTDNYPGISVRWFNVATSDGKLTGCDDIPVEVWEGVTMLCTYQLPKAELLPRLKFVQLTSAGSDQCDGNRLFEDSDIIFCSANGVHPPQIAEWVVGTWLKYQHGFSRYEQHMLDEDWEPAYQSQVEDSVGLRMGILGYGAIGRQCANLGKALGMEVVAFTMRERPTAESRRDNSYMVPGTGDADGLIPSKWFHGTTRHDLNKFLDEGLDLLVLCLPLTLLTKGMLSREQFRILSKKQCFICNVGRGGLIVNGDLVEALEMGWLRGAALDVTDPEPLPKGHPLWKAPNIFITPHVSWKSDKYWRRVLEILETNLAALNKNGNLVNRVEKGISC